MGAGNRALGTRAGRNQFDITAEDMAELRKQLESPASVRTKYEIGKNGAIAELKCCPHCKSTEGYFRNVRISGDSEYRYNYDGSNAINEHLHDTLDYVEKKTLFCVDCKRPVGLAK
jgi:hypothetical protein